MENGVIGVLDSGFGGISVLNHLLSYMPNENYVFYGDSKNSPFGTKSIDELYKIGKNIIKTLLFYDPKVIVVACGTMSTNIINDLQKEFKQVRLIGTYPTFDRALTPGLTLSESNFTFDKNSGLKITHDTKKVLIIATSATCKSKFLNDLRTSYKDVLDLYVEPADPIVKAVENETLESFEFDEYLRKLFTPYMDIDYLVLGCTHFPFAIKQIKQVLGNHVRIVSGCENAASNAKEYLDTNHKLEDITRTEDINTLKIIDSGLTPERVKMYKKLISINLDDYNVSFENTDSK